MAKQKTNKEIKNEKKLMRINVSIGHHRFVWVHGLDRKTFDSLPFEMDDSNKDNITQQCETTDEDGNALTIVWFLE